MLCDNNDCTYNAVGLGGRFCNYKTYNPQTGIELDEDGKCKTKKGDDESERQKDDSADQRD